ncbi:nuclear transport factor 2 family protein [Streptomyces sp. NEAU-YJ-81]|uniref:nuclear transport factor 2 family protein n=1 Tax=Streptomyces sp. NEAU-YJ-81 TaxID=2820288 RepID=UPI001ABD1D44|nr:nuclear transport factor 2 family protein [Streptomyces sp. NEAU-YJ-81]MBO3682261.1 nuclear transport factor 2 family protein [Streptomyces sp. NEAU-YJ-81]
MTLERRVQRLEDIHAINQLMSRRAYLHSAGMHAREIEECWAKETPGVIFEPEDWGVWEGPESIRKSYVDGAPPVEPGMLIEHCVTTGVIEVAGDRKTAKGAWISPGHETFPQPEGRPIPHWSWGRYGVDFVREGEEWKIWHLHIYTTFRTPYDKDWVESSINRPDHFPKLGETLPGMHRPDREVTFNQPYSVDAAPALQPEPPAPYDTFGETTSYTDKPARVDRVINNESEDQ